MVVMVISSRSVRPTVHIVVRSLRCCIDDSRYDVDAVRSGADDRARYEITHCRMYIPPDPGRVLRLTGALGAQPVTPSEVL